MCTILSQISFNTEISIADAASILTFLTIVISGIFALCKWTKQMKMKRAEYIKDLTTEIRTSPHMAFDVFEYGKEWYGLDFHDGSDIEERVDYTLSVFSYICYLRKQDLLNNAEFNCFKYELARILTNPHFQQYFYNLYHFSRSQNQPMTFLYLFEYAKENGYLDSEFYNPKSTKYFHVLNF